MKPGECLVVGFKMFQEVCVDVLKYREIFFMLRQKQTNIVYCGKARLCAFSVLVGIDLCYMKTRVVRNAIIFGILLHSSL